MKQVLLTLLTTASRRLVESMVEDIPEQSQEAVPVQEVGDAPEVCRFRIRLSDDEIVEIETEDVFSDYVRLSLQHLSQNGQLPERDYLSSNFDYELDFFTPNARGGEYK